MTPPIKPEHISCMGCRTEGVKYLYCSDLCPVRKCVSEKGYDTCADCAEIDACEVVAQVFKNAPEARGNLKTERLATELHKALGVLGIPWLSMLYF